MKVKDVDKQIFENANIKGKMLLLFWGFYFDRQHDFRRFTKICPHDSTFGEAGSSEHICLDCDKVVRLTL